ncbi:MAG: hypothetical protein HZA78_06440 [Candidatus Schekmanbacteria bacterium]|nr:hypothetical protein [Candidatus Schekmanbacteria bacterium]
MLSIIVDLLITWITGILHIATALGKNIIALFGGFEDPEKLGTTHNLNRKQVTAITKQKICEPCNMTL